MKTNTTNQESSKKAQSAMEYLMTYGWAILIMAVVLAALFALGLFNGNSISGNTCTAPPGFLCNDAIYSHSSGNIIADIGQVTGNNWVSANFVFAPLGEAFANGIPNVSFDSPPANTILSNVGMTSGTTATIYLPATQGNITVGTPIQGTIWAQYAYQYDAGGVVHVQTGYVQVGSLNLKAT